jgi:hypothetical protein
MELIVNGETLTGLISDRQIEESIQSLTGDGDSFAILARSNQVYIQTSGDPHNGFILEYRDGSEEEHYSCSTVDLTVDRVVRAFQSYLADDGRWKSDLEWKSQAFDYSGGAITGKKIIAAVGLILAAAVIWGIFVAN